MKPLRNSRALVTTVFVFMFAAGLATFFKYRSAMSFEVKALFVTYVLAMTLPVWGTWRENPASRWTLYCASSAYFLVLVSLIIFSRILKCS